MIWWMLAICIFDCFGLLQNTSCIFGWLLLMTLNKIFFTFIYIYIYIWGYSRREFNLKIVYFDSICNGHKGLFVIQTTTSRGGVSFMKIRAEVSNISSNLKQKLHRQWCISPKGIFFFFWLHLWNLEGERWEIKTKQIWVPHTFILW